jgi:protein-disulfide isomerase
MLDGMSGPSRDQKRAEARAQRQAAEEAERQRQQRRTRLLQLGGVLAAVVVIAVIVIVIAGGGSNDKSADNPVTVSTTADGGRAVLNAEAEINDRLSGVPQSGITLGRKNAPITIVEFADLQCPACALASQQVLPGVIDDYVRTGKAKLELRDIHFLGPDSERLARFAAAAGEQDKYWNVAELVWHNQGEENSGYATDEYLRAIGQGIPGLDVDQAMAARDSSAVHERLVEAKRLADINGVNSTPTFLVGKTGETPKTLGADKLLDELARLDTAQT